MDSSNALEEVAGLEEKPTHGTGLGKRRWKETC